MFYGLLASIGEMLSELAKFKAQGSQGHGNQLNGAVRTGVFAVRSLSELFSMVWIWFSIWAMVQWFWFRQGTVRGGQHTAGSRRRLLAGLLLFICTDSPVPAQYQKSQCNPTGCPRLHAPGSWSRGDVCRRSLTAGLSWVIHQAQEKQR